MPNPTLSDLNRNLEALDAEVLRIQARRTDASQRHAAAIKEQKAALRKLETARDDDLAAIDKELAEARAKASKAFDDLVNAKRSGAAEG